MDFTMIIIFILVVVILYFVVSKLTRASGLTGTLDAKNSHTLTNKELGIVDENQSFVNSSLCGMDSISSSEGRGTEDDIFSYDAPVSKFAQVTRNSSSTF